MALYLKLFHGRKTPDEHLDDWGSDGPVLGPLTYVHTTYGTSIHIGNADEDDTQDLTVVDGLLYYGRVWYGDWSVFGEEELVADRLTPKPYDSKKAKVPRRRRKKH